MTSESPSWSSRVGGILPEPRYSSRQSSQVWLSWLPVRGFPHFLQLYSCCYSLFLSHAPVYCCIAVYRLCSNILPLSRKKNTIKIRQSPAMTTINLALTLIPVTLCTAGYAELPRGSYFCNCINSCIILSPNSWGHGSLCGDAKPGLQAF